MPEKDRTDPMSRNNAPPFDDLPQLLRARAATQGKQAAYVFLDHQLEGGQVLSYEALGREAESLALRLKTHARPGDRVLLAFNNDLEAVQLFWGCMLARLIPIPAPATDTFGGTALASRLRGIAADAGVALAFTHDHHLETARVQVPGVPWRSLSSLLAGSSSPGAPWPAAGADGPSPVAYLQYTSGSTSAPRGVEITHGNVLAQCEALLSVVDQHHTRGLSWLPWFHDYGLVQGVIQPLYLGGTSYLMSTVQFLMRPLRWLEAIDKHQVSHSGAPDFAYAACVQALARNPGWSARLDAWQVASCGAEPVRAGTLAAFASAFAPFGFQPQALTPSYGLAEAVLAVTVGRHQAPALQATFAATAIERLEVRAVPCGTPGERTLVGCGPPLPGFELRIVDPESRLPCAPDRIGEIWIAGPSVGRGYWDQPEASAELFGATLVGPGDAPTPYLRTGDLGFLWEGELFVAGRLKDLIVVHGRNLHPQDLEQTAEAAHPHIRPAGVIALAIDDGRKESVVLLVECARLLAPDAVRQLVDDVQRHVAVEHQLEVDRIVPLRAGTLPRTTSGKRQRSEAKRRYLQGELEPLRLAVSEQSPQTLSEPPKRDAALLPMLTRLWCEVLARDEIDPDANFFDLGGDSLLATQLVSRLRLQTGVELPIGAVFQSPTLRGLSRWLHEALERRDAGVGADTMVVTPSPVPHAPGTLFPLSFSQERMWFMHEMAPQGSAYNIPLAIRLAGDLDLVAMNEAWQQLLTRHEILRTRFVHSPDGPQAEVAPVAASPIQEARLQLPEGLTPQAALEQQLAALASAPFRLDQCPLLRLHVLHTGEREAVLLIVMHHIVGDQWSCAILGRELAALYSAIQTQTPASLPALPFQYADYTEAHRRWFTEQRQHRELRFWTERLAGCEAVSLDGDFPRPKQRSFKGAALRLAVSKDDFAALTLLGARHQASLAMVLVTALQVLLVRHTGKTDFPIGVPIANRNNLASEALLGTFVNTLVFRTDLQGSPSFSEALARVRTTALEAYAHQDLPFELLVRALKLRSDPSRSALFGVAFNLINTPARDVHFHGLEWSRLLFDRGAAQFDLSVNVDPLYDPSIELEYSTELFSRSTIERMGEHLLNILRAVRDNPEVPIGAIALLGPEERALLHDWSRGPRQKLGAGNAAALLSKGLRMAPEHTALIVGEERWSHRALDEASNRLARALRRAGIARGATVALCLPRSAELIVAVLAVLKAGATYLPLDPSYPRERLAFQVSDAGPSVLLTTHHTEPLARSVFDGPRWVLDEERQRLLAESPAPLAPDAALDAQGEDAAYLIYTSGSTGRPKGVLVPQRALVNLITSLRALPGMQQQTRLLAVTTLSFDIAVTELLLPIACGATVVMATEAQALDGPALAALMEAHGVDVMQATPSRWRLLLDSGWRGRPGLRALVTGEPMPPPLARELSERCGEVWNMYGPTETTVFSSGWRVDPQLPSGISLGRPIGNTTIAIVDPAGRLCPVGVMGEIWIGGAGLALGYHRRPELTTERFVDLPSSHETGEARMYRTGDFGRWRWDGSLEHGGRMDDQVKLRGFRIELGDVETHLANCPGVRQAVAAIRELPHSGPALVGYIVPQTSMPSPQDLRRQLREHLPDHMVPTVFIAIDAVPVLANGKTHRGALPAPLNPVGATLGKTLPRTHAEQLVWTVWCELFQTTDLGVHDDFFERGGHSLLAVKLVGRLESVMRRPVPLGLLFTHTTIAELAAVLAAEHAIPDLPVALLQPLGDAPPLFLLAGADRYRALAHQLAPDLPVYGLFSQREIDLIEHPQRRAPRLSVESLADDYLALIRSVRPHGPYRLGGFSIGGIIAYEVATRLRAQGETVQMLLLLDCAPPGHGLRHYAAFVLRRLRLVGHHGLQYLLHVARVARQEAAHRKAPGQRRIKVYARAIRAYHAKTCDVPVLLVQTQNDPFARKGYGWEAWAPEVQVELVPGRHMNILEPSNAARVAQFLRRYLAAVAPLRAGTGPDGLPRSPQPDPTEDTPCN